MSNNLRNKSIYLSLILRHKPESIGLHMDANGWVNVEDLIAGVASNNRGFTLSELKQIVKDDNKGRYSFRNQFSEVRANQGHSCINIEFTKATPPELLYHGTGMIEFQSIKTEGINKGERQMVHLSDDKVTAGQVANRRKCSPVLLHIDAAAMVNDGIGIYVSDNNVWLTDYVDPKYILNVIPVGV